MTTMQPADDLLEHAPAAWRRPGIVFVVYAFRVVVALVAAAPFAFLFGAALGGFPKADALLFDDGALFLAEALRRSSYALTPLFTGALIVVALGAIVSIMPLAALIGALSTKGRLSAQDFGSMALRPIGTFSLLFGAFAFVQAVAFAIISAIGGAVARRPSFDAPTSDRLRWGILLVGLLIVCLLGVWHDLARVAVVRDELGFKVAVRRGLRALRTNHVRVIGAWAVRALLGLVALYAGLSIGSRLGVDTSAKVLIGFLVYQASIILALFLRASWLASAIRHIDQTRPVVVVAPEPELPEAPVAQEQPAESPAVEESAIEAPPADVAATNDSLEEKSALDGTNSDSQPQEQAQPSAGNSDVADNLDTRA